MNGVTVLTGPAIRSWKRQGCIDGGGGGGGGVRGTLVLPSERMVGPMQPTSA